MKKKICVAVLLLLAVCFSACGCGAAGDTQAKARMQAMAGENRALSGPYDPALAAVCSNGVFVGRESDGVVAFKGVPFAQPPTGALRWKPPVPAADGTGVYEAYYFGKSPIQTAWPSEVGSYYPQGEDCLNLNVWTSDGNTSSRAVMVFFHGGSYGWGATSDPLYDGERFVRAHPDVVLVTAEYRTGILGFLDLSAVPGGDAYAQSGNLGLLDMVCALQWVQKNIAAFGGDPGNVTIFGESAGGGAVSLLPLMAHTEGLFHRVIAESGSVALTYSRAECRRLTQMLLATSGAASMADLTALSEAELMRLNENLNDYNNFPERDGVVLPENLYQAYAEGKAAHVDLLIGTNADEARYWIKEMGYTVPLLSGETTYRLLIPVMFESNCKRFSAEDRQLVSDFLQLQTEQRVWNLTEFYNEILFRVPAAFQAQANAANGGTAYVYYWSYPSAHRHLGACHAVELAYVFNNLTETIYTGENIDAGLAATVQEMWVNFAKTGDPSTETLRWQPYDGASRACMVLDAECRMENEILERQRALIEPLLQYGLNGCYTDLDLRVPVVYFYAGAVAAALGLIVTAVCLAVRRKRNKRKKGQ